VHTLDNISPGWLAAYKGYYADAGALRVDLYMRRRMHDGTEKTARRARLLVPARLPVPWDARKAGICMCPHA
jgi:hypothetical protein